MHKSEDGLLPPCTYSQEDETNLDEITSWPFDDVSRADIEYVRSESDDYHAYMNRIEALMDIKNATTIRIPYSQKELIRNALTQYLADMERLVKCPTQSQAYEMFDLQQLAALMNYDVKVTLSADQARTFAAINGIDLPQYN